jgi:hypothetical protein
MPRKVLILDTYYPKAIAKISPAGDSYDEMLRSVLSLGFGTADFVSDGFRSAGWQAIDVIANFDLLQKKWQRENCPGIGMDWLSPDEAVLSQIKSFAPDVLFLQDVSFLSPATMKFIRERGIKIAAQISCAMPREENVRQCDVVFTSFPHFVKKFEALGVRGVFSKLCFAKKLLSRVTEGLRDYPVVFVGGVCGNDSTGCWAPGTLLLEEIAYAVPGFQWWGYGVETLRAGSTLAGCYRGEAWGLDQYRVYARAKIALNRHSIHANNCGNNMRCHEVTGMGAMLLTDSSDSYKDLEECVVYRDSDDLIRCISSYLETDATRESIALAGQNRCLAENTYDVRYKEIASVLEAML